MDSILKMSDELILYLDDVNAVNFLNIVEILRGISDTQLYSNIISLEKDENGRTFLHKVMITENIDA